LKNQANSVLEILTESKAGIDQERSRWEEFLNGINNMSVLIQEISQELDSLEKNHHLNTEVFFSFKIIFISPEI
jgi:hypothetical protein